MVSKTVKASSTKRFETKKIVNKKERFRDILGKYGIPSPRLGGYEYMVATNLMILEELKRLNKISPTMLDY